MTAPTFASPSTVPIGTFVIDIKSGTPTTGAGTAVDSFVAENFTVTRASNVVKRPNEIGGPNGLAIVDSFVEGTATLQIPTWSNTQKLPATGNWFKLTLDPLTAGVAEYFAIHSVSQPFSFGEYLKENISFIKITTPSS